MEEKPKKRGRPPGAKNKKPKGLPGPPPIVKMTNGRPSKYQKEFDEIAQRLALLGLTNGEIAKYFDVAPSTFNLWLVEHQSFSEAVKEGREGADGRVAAALFHRAMGYKVETTKIIQTKDGGIVKVPHVEHYPPDPTSCIFYLKNRQPKFWRDKRQYEYEAGPNTDFKLTIKTAERKDEE
jgi:hypothetical protein